MSETTAESELLDSLSSPPNHYSLSFSSVTLVSGAIIVVLFLSEFAYFMSTDVSEALTSDCPPLCILYCMFRFGRSSSLTQAVERS